MNLLNCPAGPDPRLPLTLLMMLQFAAAGREEPQVLPRARAAGSGEALAIPYAAEHPYEEPERWDGLS
ncbi:hypothetical protein [Fontivita pretiosa]|jgi:hypothetical protein|uniref:hypothetical protein n=1 Tax=Fontivita pretiosa TaxID=2989684 RepID=UPI003D182B48